MHQLMLWVLLQVMATHGRQITAAALKDMVYTEAVVRLAEPWLCCVMPACFRFCVQPVPLFSAVHCCLAVT